MNQSFTELNLPEELKAGLDLLGFSEMTEIQEKALPSILAGQDVIGKAKTGSGKTLTFALGILHRLNMQRYRIQGLVLCPTRELAEQVAQDIRELGRKIDNLKVLTLCGGSPMGPQIDSLRHGAHIIVGTPGRIMDHILKRRLNLGEVNTLVLDEADRMLDMGFEEEMQAVIRVVPSKRQTLLFSATYPDSIQSISNAIQQSPQEITVSATHNTNKIKQTFFEVAEPHKLKSAAALLSEYQPESAIIFCNTKLNCQQTAEELAELGFSTVALHGDLEQKERNQVMVRFSNKSALILVATDVAARGLDVKEVELVINFDITPDPEVHIHRIGRTGRADKEGIAVTLCEPKEINRANAIEDYQGSKISWKGIQAMRFHSNRIVTPSFTTIAIDGGKKAKLRPGDILGALTQDANIAADDIGKIKITATHSYVAIKVRSVKRALNHFKTGRIKAKKFKARKLV